MKSKAVLKLTSEKLKGNITSENNTFDKENFIAENKIKTNLIEKLFEEVKENGFGVKIGGIK